MLSSPGLCPGLSLQCPLIPAQAEAKHPKRGQRKTQHHFVPLPLSCRVKESQEMKVLERGAPVLLQLQHENILEHPMDETKGPLSLRFSPSRGCCSFFLPSLLHVWDANAGSEVSVLPPDVGASPEPLAEPGQRPAHPAPAPINSRRPDKILLSSGLFSPAGTCQSRASEGFKGFRSKQSNKCFALARFPAERRGEVRALAGCARGQRDRSHRRECVTINPSCAATSHRPPSSPRGQ